MAKFLEALKKYTVSMSGYSVLIGKIGWREKYFSLKTAIQAAKESTQPDSNGKTVVSDRKGKIIFTVYF